MPLIKESGSLSEALGLKKYTPKYSYQAETPEQERERLRSTNRIQNYDFSAPVPLNPYHKGDTERVKEEKAKYDYVPSPLKAAAQEDKPSYIGKPTFALDPIHDQEEYQRRMKVDSGIRNNKWLTQVERVQAQDVNTWGFDKVKDKDKTFDNTFEFARQRREAAIAEEKRRASRTPNQVIDEAPIDEWEASLKRIKGEYQDIRKSTLEQNRRLMDDMRAGVPMFVAPKGDRDARGTEQVNRYDMAMSTIQHSLNLLNQIKAIRADKNGFLGMKGVGRGFADAATDIKTWNAISDLTQSKAARDVVDKFNNDPTTLADDEKKLIEALAISNVIEMELGELAGPAYRGGQVTAHALPFMADIALTGGLTGGAGKAAIKTLAEKGLLTGAGKLTRFGKWAVKLAANAGASVAATEPIRMGRVLADKERRMTGTALMRDGNIEVLAPQETSEWAAFGKALGADAIEVASETMGRAIHLGKIFGKVVPKGIKASALGKMVKRFVSNDIIRGVRNTTQIQGFGEEFLEEMIGGAANAALIGDQSFKEVFSKDGMKETALALLPMQLGFGLMGSVGYGGANMRLRGQIKKHEKALALQGIDLEAFKREVAPLNYEQRVAKMHELAEAAAREKMKEQQGLDNLGAEIPMAMLSYIKDVTALDVLRGGEEEEYGKAQERVHSRAHEYAAEKVAQNELVNESTGGLVSADFMKKPVFITKGKLMFTEDGQIDMENSDEVLYGFNQDGDVIPIPIDAVENLQQLSSEQLYQNAFSEGMQMIANEEVVGDGAIEEEEEPIGNVIIGDKVAYIDQEGNRQVGVVRSQNGAEYVGVSDEQGDIVPVHIDNVRPIDEATEEVVPEEPQNIVAPEAQEEIQGEVQETAQEEARQEEEVVPVSVDTHSEQEVADDILSQSQGDKEIAIETAKFELDQAKKEIKKLSKEVPLEAKASRGAFIQHKLQQKAIIEEANARLQKMQRVIDLLEQREEVSADVEQDVPQEVAQEGVNVAPEEQVGETASMQAETNSEEAQPETIPVETAEASKVDGSVPATEEVTPINEDNGRQDAQVHEPAVQGNGDSQLAEQQSRQEATEQLPGIQEVQEGEQQIPDVQRDNASAEGGEQAITDKQDEQANSDADENILDEKDAIKHPEQTLHPNLIYKSPYSFASKKKKDKPALRGVLHADGYAVASTGSVLVADKTAYKKEHDGKIIGRKGDEIDDKYPKWERVITNDESNLQIDLSGLSSKLSEVRKGLESKPIGKQVASNIVGEPVVAVQLFDNNLQWFRLSEIERFVGASIKLGLDEMRFDNIKLSSRGENGFCCVVNLNDDYFREKGMTPDAYINLVSGGVFYESESFGKDLAKESKLDKDATAADVITDQVSKEINKRQKQYQRLVDQLRKTGLALDVIDSQEAYDKKLKEVAENKGTTFRDLKGRVYGFANNETVYIDPSKMDLNTPIHEFTHLWYSAMKSKDPELVKRGLELVKRTKYYREVKNSSEYQGLSEEQILDEALAHALGDLGEKQVAKKGVIRTKLGLWVKEFFDKLRSLFGVESDVDMYDFADMVLSDLLSGKSIGSAKENGTRFRMSDEQEQIKQQALANGSFMKAPNGEPSNLNEHQWTQVRTKAFKNWFGDWEKSARIEKLRKAEPVVLQGNEHEGKYELNGKSAQGYILSTLRGEYTNKDTGDVIRITRKGAEKVTRHDAESDVHLRSIASIPQMIENATFIEEVDNDKSKNGFSTYRYYVVGLRIDDVDYTAKLVVGVASNGDAYYDHALTEIEKGNLISAIDPIKRGFGTEEATLSEVKDKRLLSILQTDASKVVDENGEPMVVYHGTSVNGRRFFKFKEDLPIWFTPSLQYSKAFSLDNNKPVIYPSFIRSKNMVYVGNIDGVVDDRPVKLLSELSGLPVGKIQQIAADTKADYLYQITNSEQFKYLISSNGYDGISAREGGVLSYAVFSPTQIKSATENVGTFDQENPDIRFRIGERRKADMRAGLLNKLTNATEEQVERTIAEIEKLGESTKEGGNPKLEKVAFHWAKKGTIILPEDNDKVIHAVKLSESFKVDPIKYDNPMEIINEYSPDVEYGEPVDPDSIPEFTNKREIGSTGVFVYDVEESEKAQEAVCKIAHAQFGWDPKANLSKQPWCLASFTRKGSPTESAKNFWANTYNSVGKKIAFQDGKVIAFMAHDKGIDTDVWWNLTDDPSYNLPLPSGDYINPDGEIEPERGATNSDDREEAIELVAQEIPDDELARMAAELYVDYQLHDTLGIERAAGFELERYISENIESFNSELEDYEEEYREERGIDQEDDIDRSEMIERFIESVDAQYSYRPFEFFDDDSARKDFVRYVAESVAGDWNREERIAVLSDYLGYVGGSSEYEQVVQEYQDQRRESNSLRFRTNLRNEINLNPSDRQKEAGNYKKAHIRVDGFDMSIETPKGGIRSGVDENGVPWSTTMQNDYGYIRGTKGKDGDHIDIFLGNLSTGSVFVVDQVKEDGSFDEHKVMYGFGSKEEAEAAYLSSYSPGWKGLGNITEVSKEDFKEWVKSSKRKTKPFAEYKKYGNNAILQQVNDKFNKDIKELTEENARGKILELGNPSDVLLSAGISDRPIKLYGSKLLAKARKHGFKFGDVANLPIAVANPVAVFDGSERGSFAILTELLIGGRNVLASLSVGRNNDVDFNLVRSVYGKNKRGVIDWILNGKMRYANKEKALDYLRISAPIAEAQDNQELSSATKIIEDFENPSVKENGPVRFRVDNRSLVAVHNLSEDNLRKAVELGGFPMPSIAITDVGVGHSKFGEISLIFDKSSINPSDRRNKVYSGDGWTPMFPSVNFKINESVSKKIRNDVEALLHDYNYIDEYRLHLDDYNIDDSVNRSGSFSEAYKSNVAMKIAYIKHIGIPFKPVLKKKEYSSTVDNDTLKKITKEVGNGDATALMNLGIDEKMALEPTIRGIVSSSFEQKLSNIDHESKLFSYLKEQANKELSFSEVDNILYSAYLYQKDGDKVIIDNAKTRERVEKKFTKKMNEGYDEWLNNLSNGIIEKRGIRNNVDPFTRSGNRRSWNALFDEVTLDNVVKAMMSKSEKGGDGFFGGSIFGAAQSRITSIDDIRDFAKSHIKEVSDEEMSAARKEITDRLSKIQIQGVGDGIGDVLDLSENIVEAVKRSHDAKGLYKYLKHYYPGITLEVSEEIADIVKDIKNLSTRYLEAKPMRAVGFREVKAAVVPKGIDESLVDILQANGIDVVEYKKGDEAARRRAISKVTKENELRFRASNEETAYDTAFGKSIKESKAARIAKKFSVPISTKVVSRFDLPKEQQKKAVIYDNGSLSVVMENVRNGELERAILEEVLPKQGLSALADEDTKKEVLSILGELSQSSVFIGGTPEAMEEYIKDLHDQIATPQVIENMATAMNKMLEASGFDVKLSDAEAAFMMYDAVSGVNEAETAADDVIRKVKREKVRRKLSEYDEVFHKMTDEQVMDELNPEKDEDLRMRLEDTQRKMDAIDVMFRVSGSNSGMTMAEKMDKVYSKRGVERRRKWVDETVVFDKYLKEIEKIKGEPIPDFANVSEIYNQSSSVATATIERLEKDYYNPTIERARRIKELLGFNDRQLHDYMMAKHAPERNSKMRDNIMKEQGISFQEAQKMDFAYQNGLEQDAIPEDFKDMEGFENVSTAEDLVKAVEDKLAGASLSTKEKKDMQSQGFSNYADYFWDAMNKLNKNILLEWHKSGMLSKESYDKIRSMYDYYIPMRGFDQEVAGDVWEYYDRGSQSRATNEPVRKATGRKSRPDNPFFAIRQTLRSAAIVGRRNVEKQAVYYLTRYAPADYLTTTNMWYDANTGEPIFPDTDADGNYTPEVIADFENEMYDKLKQGLVTMSRSNGPKLGMFATNLQKQEHIVRMMFDGIEKVVYVNGNPKFAQMANRRNRGDEKRGKFFRGWMWANRQMSANFTSRSLDFVVANFIKDYQWATGSLMVREGGKYTLEFQKNVGRACAFMAGRKTDELRKLYDEFIENGGKTGYASLESEEKAKRQSKYELSTETKHKVARVIGKSIDIMSVPAEMLENITRFATYMTSRQMGRSIQKSVANAKDVTVNFNRRGAGGNLVYDLLIGSQIFFNAGIQGADLMYKMIKQHPIKSSMMMLSMAGLALFARALSNMLCGDDDDNGYDLIDSYTRGSNFCVMIDKDTYIKVPLSIELKVFYGMGEWLQQYAYGNASWQQASLGAADCLVDAVPFSPIAGGESLVKAREYYLQGDGAKGWYTGLRNLVPSILQPISDSFANVNFTGNRIYNDNEFVKNQPNWMTANSNTPKILIDGHKLLHRLVAGNQYASEAGRNAADMIHPSLVHYLAIQYFGGLFKTASQVTNVADNFGEEGASAFSRAPLANRFFRHDEKMEMRNLQTKFFELRSEIGSNAKKYKTRVDNIKSAEGWLERKERQKELKEWSNGVDYRDINKYFGDVYNRLKDMDGRIALSDGDKRKKLIEQKIEIMSHAISKAEKRMKKAQ